MDNSILTSHPDCAGNQTFWGGVLVEGNPVFSQFPPDGVAANSCQAVLYMENYSEIRYATVGANAGVSPSNLLGPLSSAGGGVIMAQDSKFRNNLTAVQLSPFTAVYDYYVSSLQSACYFRRDVFIWDDPNIFDVASNMVGINGYGVNGIPVTGCTFLNTTAIPDSIIGINGTDFGVNISPQYSPSYMSTFQNLAIGVSCATIDIPNYGVSIVQSNFNGNSIGVSLSNTTASKVANCNFTMDYTSYPVGVHGLYYNIEFGLIMYGANMFSVYNNHFTGDNLVLPHPILHGTSIGYSNPTVGIMAYNTSMNNNNVINNNTFNNLGYAALGELVNRDATTSSGEEVGLWFHCNSFSNDLYDIATIARSSSGGIRSYQGTPADGSTSAVTAANTFTVGGLLQKNIYQYDGAALNYFYSSSAPTPEDPVAHSASVTTTTLPVADNCPVPIGTTLTPYPVNGTQIDDANFASAVSNINYYMCDSAGIAHKDSLYYWLAYKHNPASDLMRAQMLLADGFPDSATAIYSGIPNNYTLDSLQNVWFGTDGAQLFQVYKTILAPIAASKAADTAHGVADTTYAYTGYAAPSYRLDSASDAILLNLVANSGGWVKNAAENLLSVYDTANWYNAYENYPDTIFFPTDTINVSFPKGVLAVTEITQGPQQSSQDNTCQYAEMVVANCGADTSSHVDVSGWILDDNSGNFDTAGCSDAYGVTRGHYRLAYNNIWQFTPVGSIIVVYNADNDCYNLPTSFTYDSVNGIYWIPVSSKVPDGYVLQRYNGRENASACTYCSDTGTNVYTDASSWDATINLYDKNDAFQVRCPGCTASNTATPSFYQGVGYYTTDSSGFASIEPVSGVSLGGPVLQTNVQQRKIVFVGSTASDFGSLQEWQLSSADPGGSQPSTLGVIPAALLSNILSHSLNLPCCATGTDSGGRRGVVTKNGVSASTPITVYPNPAHSVLYFTFPQGSAGIVLSDITGRKVAEVQVANTGTYGLPVGGLQPGVYLYEITTPTQTLRGKVVVE